MLVGLGVVFVPLPLFVGFFFAGYWDWVVEKAEHPGGFGVWAYVVEFLGFTVEWILLFYSWSSLMAIIGGALLLIAVIVGILDQRKIQKSRQGAVGVGYGASGFSGGGFSGGGGASGGW